MRNKPAIAFLLLLFSIGLRAEPAKPSAEMAFGGFTWDKDEVVAINAAKMSLSLKEKKAVFTGKVVVNKGKSQIYCDKLAVDYVEGGQIAHLKATGSVKMVEGKSFATGDELEYFKDRKKIFLRGNPRLVSEGQIVLGDEMVFNVGLNRLTVTAPKIQFQKEKQ
jgi:lipopolysaccharide transport protein LptA